MKTDRRHELQTNELADWMGTKLEQIKPYSKAILIGVSAVAVIVAAVLFVRYSNAQGQARGWQELRMYSSFAYIETRRVQATEDIDKEIEDLRQRGQDIQREMGLVHGDQQALAKIFKRLGENQELLDQKNKERNALRQQATDDVMEEIANLAKEHRGTPVGCAADLQVGEYYLQRGLAQNDEDGAQPSNPADNKASETASYSKAIDHFKLARDHATAEMIQQRARYGLARVYESRNRRDDQNKDNDDVQLAIAEYEKLAEGAVYGAIAARRLRTLRDADDRVESWLADARKAADAKNPTTGPPPAGPGASGTVSSSGDDSLYTPSNPLSPK